MAKRKQKQILSLESTEPEVISAPGIPSWRLFGVTMYRLPWFAYVALALLSVLAGAIAVVAASGIFNMHLGFIDQVSLCFTAWVFGVTGLSIRPSNNAKKNHQLLIFIAVGAFAFCKTTLALIGALVLP